MENPVNVQAKNMLAKLLATENITIVHAGIRTATFDVQKRILTLPIWKQMSGDLYDLFVLHEISHALNSPKDIEIISEACMRVDPKFPKYAKRFINIIEDARIERLIKKMYPGGRGAFYRGYQELIERDFFGTKNADINGFGIIDKINIYFKTGNNAISFTPDEMLYIQEIEKLMTFDEVVNLCVRLYAYARIERNKKKSKQQDENQDLEKCEKKLVSIEDNDVLDPDIEDIDESEKTNETTKTNEHKKSIEKSKDDKTNEDKKDIEIDDSPVDSITDRTWEEKQKSLNDDESPSIQYLGISKPKLDKIIVPYKKVHEQIRKFYIKSPYLIKLYTEEFEKFKHDNNPVIGWLLKEFEMRKAADQYSRTKQSKTGNIDMSKLNQYKFSDEILLKTTNIIGGKNHALEVFVDWSGSMSDHLLGTIHQVINLAIFAKKAQIPFNVYTFGAQISHKKEILGGRYANDDMFSFEVDDFAFYCGFSLRQILSSKMHAHEFNDACINLLLMTHGQFPRSDCLGGTPLNEAIVSSIDIILNLKKRYQIVNAIFITDGEATTDGSYVSDLSGGTNCINYLNNKVFLRDSETHIDYPLSINSIQNTKQFLSILRERTNANVIGFFIVNDKKLDSAFISLCPEKWNNSKEKTEIIKELNDNNFVLILNKGYTEFYVIRGAKSLIIKVPTPLTGILTGIMGNQQMITTMTKQGKEQRKQRVVLSRFIKLIS